MAATAATASHDDDQETIFASALSWFGHFDVQHTVDPLDGVYLHDRAFNPAPAASDWAGDAAEAAAVEPPVGTLRLTVAQLPDRSHVRLFAHFVWNSGLVLAALVDHGRVPVAGRTVIELGAGIAAPSLVAALRGAQRVVATDYPDPAILTNIGANADRNLPDPTARAKVEVRGHLWGSDDLAAEPARFDVVLLADVLWMPEQHAPLLQSCRRLVKPAAAGGRIFLSFGKHTGGEITDAFFALATSPAMGFQARCVNVYRYPTEWGDAKLDDYNETRRTVFTYELWHPNP